ncbi:MAG TPA: acyltransferase [Chitinophagaceae bacterium]|nr:acyltransferase [Chitinophagaceae bacterium]
MSTEIPQRTHYPALDGLRGVAILLVVLYHNFGFVRQSYFGWLGVDLFFVLSGFLITSILINEVDHPGFLKKFYIRRVLRIFPLYYLVLILFLLVFPSLGFLKADLDYFVNNQWWFWTYLQNWLFSFQLTEDAKILTHFWSLAVEEQFYLIWPFIILAIKSPKKLFFLMLGILFIVIISRSVIWLYKIENLNYTTLYTFTRIDGICIGSMLALLMKFRPRLIIKNLTCIVLILAAMNFLFYFVNQQNKNGYPYFAFVGYTTFCAMFGLLIHEIVISAKTSLLNRILSFGLLRFFGKISYGFYIFHWPIYMMSFTSFFIFIKENFIISESSIRIVAALLSTFLAFIISVLSYYLFESYFLRLKKEFAS